MKVDVVIPTLNSSSVLDMSLKSILKFIPFNKIIIIDGGSTDKTLEIARKYKCDISVCKCSLGESRMLGISKVSTDWLLFIDSDIVVNREFFGSVMKYIRKDVGAIQGIALKPEEYDGFKKNPSKVKYLGFNERGFTNCTLIRTELIKDVDLKGIEAYEDWMIKNHILKKKYIWMVIPAPVKHFHDYGGSVDVRLKARWNGAGLRKSGVASPAYLLKWFLGISVKKPIVKRISFKKFKEEMRYFFDTLIGYLFYEKYLKIKR